MLFMMGTAKGDFTEYWVIPSEWPLTWLITKADEEFLKRYAFEKLQQRNESMNCPECGADNDLDNTSCDWCEAVFGPIERSAYFRAILLSMLSFGGLVSLDGLAWAWATGQGLILGTIIGAILGVLLGLFAGLAIGSRRGSTMRKQYSAMAWSMFGPTLTFLLGLAGIVGVVRIVFF